MFKHKHQYHESRSGQISGRRERSLRGMSALHLLITSRPRCVFDCDDFILIHVGTIIFISSCQTIELLTIFVNCLCIARDEEFGWSSLTNCFNIHRVLIISVDSICSQSFRINERSSGVTR